MARHPLLHNVRIVPCKVPLGKRWADKIPEQFQWTPKDMLRAAYDMYGVNAVLVIDLTFVSPPPPSPPPPLALPPVPVPGPRSPGRPRPRRGPVPDAPPPAQSDNYYTKEEVHSEAVKHVKIKCRGRGQVPQPLAVNSFLSVMMDQLITINKDYRQKEREAEAGRLDPAALALLPCILVHCTHGFNRTGYMLVQLLQVSPVPRYPSRRGRGGPPGVVLEGEGARGRGGRRARVALTPTPVPGLPQRLDLTKGLVPVASNVRAFADCRAPGIYKDDYISTLFDYFHEKRPSSVATPERPPWKASGEPPRGRARLWDRPPRPCGPPAGARRRGRLTLRLNQPPPAPPHLSADEDDESGDDEDVGGTGFQADPLGIVTFDPKTGHPELETVGELVTQQERTDVLRTIFSKISRGRLGENYEQFLGSQPVSLERKHLDELKRDDYMVTWKADGVRFILMSWRSGTYLVDRKCQVRRVQVRLPWIPGRDPRDNKSPYELQGIVQNPLVILDGELVADEDRSKGTFKLVYLAYDLIEASIVGPAKPSGPSQVADRSFRERWGLIESHVLHWRRMEKGKLEHLHKKHPSPHLPAYDYAREPIYVRRKDFWEMDQTRRILKFIETLPHESDGLIYQGGRDAYVPRTHDGIMKWKFSQLNSVDFQVQAEKADGPNRGKAALCVLENRGRDELEQHRLQTGEERRTRCIYPTGEYLLLDEGLDEEAQAEAVQDLVGAVVECVWDPRRRGWKKLRLRTDKQMPNAYTVYQSVIKTIEENITSEELVGIGQRKCPPAKGAPVLVKPWRGAGGG